MEHWDGAGFNEAEGKEGGTEDQPNGTAVVRALHIGGELEAPGGGRVRRTRRKRAVRPKTFAIRRINKEELRLGALLYPERDYWRPRTRGECRNTERPCPFVACKYHLYLDVGETGSIKFNFPDLEVWELQETCALDVAELTGGITLEETGEVMNLTRERIRQLEASGIRRLIETGMMGIVEAQCSAAREAREAYEARAEQRKSKRGSRRAARRPGPGGAGSKRRPAG